MATGKGRFFAKVLGLGGVVTVGAGRAALTMGMGRIRGLAAQAGALLSGGFLAALPSLIGDRNKDEKNVVNAIDKTNVQRPEIIRTEIKPDQGPAKALSATLQFSKYVEKTTDDVKPIRAIGKILPEIKVNKKYSPIMKEIIENVNDVKKRVVAVEKKTFLQTTLLMKLRSASMVMSDKIQEAVEESKDNELNQRRKQDEIDIERKGIGKYEKLKNFAYDNVFRKTKDSISGIKDTIITALKTFAVPLGLLSLGFLADLAEASDSGGEGPLTEGEMQSAGVAGALGAFRRVFGGGTGRNIPSPKGKNTFARNQTARYKRNLRNMTRALNALKTIPGVSKIASLAIIIATIPAINAIFARLDNGELSEAEAEQRIKEQLVILVNGLGGSFIGGYIGGLVGGKAGAMAGAVFTPGGAAIGGLSGLAIGAWWGSEYGAKFMQQAGATELIVNALFDYIIGNESSLKEIWDSMMKMVSYSNEELIRQGYSTDMSPADMIIRSTEQRRITDEEGNEIRYKSTLSMFGVDERGILTALSRVKTPEEYYDVKKKVEEVLGEENFEDFLSDKLTREEVAIVIESMKNSMFANRNLRPEDITEFFKKISTNSEIFEAVSPEFFDMIKKGNAVPVILADGTRSVMTVEEIQNALIPDAQRVRLLNRAEEQRQRYRLLLDREALDQSSSISGIPVMSDFAIGDEMFRNAPQLRTSPDNSQVSITPIVMPIPMQNNMDTGSLNRSKSSTAQPDPSSITSDSFLNIAYTT